MLKRILPLLAFVGAVRLFAVSPADFASNSLAMNDASGMSSPISAAAMKRSSGQIDYPSISAPDSLIRLTSGDQLRLRWWGVGSGELDLAVDTRGDLVIPDMGRISTRGRNLRDLRDSVEAILKRRIKPTLIDLQLIKINKANVRLSGLVAHPGIFDCPAGTRVIQLLKQTGFDVSQAIDSLTSDMPGLYYAMDQVPSLRRVLLVRGGKDSVWLDLVRALRSGDATQDPPLFDGDALRIVPRDALVTFASGGFSGYIEMLPGEPLTSLMLAAGEVDLEHPVEVMEKNGASRKVIPSETRCDSTFALVTMPLKKPIFLPPVVWIVGQVAKPGAYTYTAGMKASDLVKLAGGIVGGEDSGVVVSTKRGWNWLAAAREKGLPESYQLPELKVAMMDYLNHMRGNYSDPDVQIQIGDTVYVYKAEQVVWVGGKVNRPGFVTWKKGADVNFYVNSAGGFSQRAWEARIQVIDWQTLQARGLEQAIRPSAAIIVPEERFISADQWFSIAATTVSLAIAATGLIVQLSLYK
ncbi:MAG: hypothetical protein RL173_203 [Fibrobacterota bacterium]|jgi:protein involved in polysaccharide export with SLBB domain